MVSLLFSGALAGTEPPEPKLLKIDTEKLSLVMSVNKEGELLFQHFGPRIEEVSPFLEKTEKRRSHPYEEMAYLSLGSVFEIGLNTLSK